MTELVTERFDRFMANVPQAIQAWHDDAEFHRDMLLLQQALSVADEAMATAGAPIEVRERIVVAALADRVADVETATWRRREHRERLDELRSAAGRNAAVVHIDGNLRNHDPQNLRVVDYRENVATPEGTL